MKNKVRIIIGVVAALALVGCVNVPQTRIDYGDLHLRAPKDTDLSGLQITKIGTNQIQVTLQSYKARMNPDVVAATAAGQAQLIQATAQGTGAALGEALRAFLAAQGLGGGIPLAPPNGNTATTGTNSAAAPPK